VFLELDQHKLYNDTDVILKFLLCQFSCSVRNCFHVIWVDDTFTVSVTYWVAALKENSVVLGVYVELIFNCYPK
jgi:hypothetical protein